MCQQLKYREYQMPCEMELIAEDLRRRYPNKSFRMVEGWYGPSGVEEYTRGWLAFFLGGRPRKLLDLEAMGYDV